MDPEEQARVDRRIRRSAWLNTPLLVVTGIAYAVFAGTGWLWPLFLWGLALGPAAIVGTRVVRHLGIRLVSGSPEEAAELRRTMSRRLMSTHVGLIGIGVCVGTISASAENSAVDVGFSLVAVLGVLVSLCMLPWVPRNAAAQRRSA